jgi:hypothetical protein
MRTLMSTTLFAAALLASTAASSATIYTDRTAWLSAAGSVTTDTFDAPDGGFIFYGATYPGSGFSISVDGGNGIYTVSPSFFPAYDWGTGPVLDLEFGLTTVSAGGTFGFDYGNPSDYPGTGVVTIDGDDYTLLGQPTFNFFGVVGATGPVVINWNGGLGIIDNFSVAGAVPEPANWAMLIAGFGLVGAAARRRRSVAA